MTSGIVSFLFAWWLLLCAIALLLTVVRPKVLLQTLRIVGCATLGGMLVNFVIVQFPGLSLDQAFEATHADSSQRLLVFVGWVVGKFLGPTVLPLLGWLIGLLIGVLWAYRRARTLPVVPAMSAQAWPPQ